LGWTFVLLFGIAFPPVFLFCFIGIILLCPHGFVPRHCPATIILSLSTMLIQLPVPTITLILCHTPLDPTKVESGCNSGCSRRIVQRTSFIDQAKQGKLLAGNLNVDMGGQPHESRAAAVCPSWAPLEEFAQGACEGAPHSPKAFVSMMIVIKSRLRDVRSRRSIMIDTMSRSRRLSRTTHSCGYACAYKP